MLPAQVIDWRNKKERPSAQVFRAVPRLGQRNHLTSEYFPGFTLLFVFVYAVIVVIIISRTRTSR